MNEWLRFPLQRVKRMSRDEWRELLARQSERAAKKAVRSKPQLTEEPRTQAAPANARHDDLAYNRLLRELQRPARELASRPLGAGVGQHHKRPPAGQVMAARARAM